MEKRDFIVSLEELIKKEDLLSVGRDVKELRQQLEDYTMEEMRQYQAAELKAQEKGETFTQEDWITSLKEEFYQIYSSYKEKRQQLLEEKKVEEEENLQKKRNLIHQLEKVIAEETNIGAAFSAQKEINEKWKEVGDISRNHRHKVQQRYSQLLETFFYNINIYKEIKAYDFKKNYEAKKEIIEKLKYLLKLEDIREIEAAIKQLQNEWEDIGPTKPELWKEIKDEYWTIVHQLYDRIRSFYKDRKEQRKENIDLKKGIIQKTEDLLQKERSSVKIWNKHTKNILQLQKEWKEIGRGTKKENDRVWKDFRKLCDTFFDGKRKYFAKAEEEFDQIAAAKKKLIEKVEAIKENTDWRITAEKIIKIQKEWKKAGNAGQKQEQKLWEEFRAACDYFFEAKERSHQQEEKDQKENLKQKEALIHEITDFQILPDKKESLASLKSFSERFAAIGFVPQKQKEEIYKSYKAALHKNYNALDLPEKEKEKIMFQARLTIIKGSGNSARLFQKEKDILQKERDKVKKEVMQYETNLEGFFKHTEDAHPLKQQALKSLEEEQKRLKILQEKIKMIPNE